MQLKQLSKTEQPLLDVFVTGLNAAFSARSSDKIPYEPEQKEALQNPQLHIFLAMDEAGTGIGGFCTKMIQTGDRRVMALNHVWVLPQMQGQGIAGKMLSTFLASVTEQDAELLRLNVAHCYKPAIRLYRRLGFRPLRVYANEPKTYHFVRMILDVAPYHYPTAKRYFMLAKSWLKFRLLYHSDSTPTLLCRCIYRR